jgi:hypothetical protein
VTWSSRPLKGPLIASFTPGNTTSVWREVDVTSAAAAGAGGVISLVIDSTHGDAYAFNSRNATTNGVELLVESSATTPSPPPSPTPTPTPTPGASPTVPAGPPVLVGAGDIAGSGSGDSQTAAIIDGLPPDTHVFTLGDNAYDDGTAAQFANYYEPTWGRFKTRTHPTIGNHDAHVFGAPAYFDYFEPHTQVGNRGEGWYAYDFRDWRMYALNSECNGSPYDFCDHDAQKAWLQADLAANPRHCFMAMWHRAMKAASSSHDDDEGNFLDVWQILYDAGAALVLTGHDHNYQRYAPYNRDSNGVDPNGLREIVVGTGGRSLSSISEQSKPGLEAYNGSTFGVLKVTLNDDSYEWQFLPVAGNTYTDSGSDNCRGPLATPPPAPTQAAEAMSIDTVPTGNGATTLGPRHSCVEVPPGGTVFLDITVEGIQTFDDGGTPGSSWDDTGGIIGYSYKLLYDAAIISVQSQFTNFLLHANAGSSLFAGASDPRPDADGSFTSAVLDIGNGIPESGDGVLDRLTVRAASGASGLFAVTLSENAHVDASGMSYRPLISNDGVLAVGMPCPSPPPSPTATPTPSPSIVFNGSTTTVNSTASSSLVIPRPAGTVPGDVLVASLALNGSRIASAPAGWVPLTALTGGTGNPRLYAYYRVAGTSDPASYTWTTRASVAGSGGIARYSGVDTANPLAAAVSTATSSTTVSSLTVPGVTAAVPGAMLIGSVAINASPLSVMIESPTGMSERWDLGGKRQEYDDALQAAAGESGSRTWTFSGPREAAGWLAALRPAQ